MKFLQSGYIKVVGVKTFKWVLKVVSGRFMLNKV